MSDDTRRILNPATLSDRETLLLIANQLNQLTDGVARINASLEQMEQRFVASDQRHATTTNAINLINGRILDLERKDDGLKKDQERRAEEQAKALAALAQRLDQLEQRLVKGENEYHTWKTRVQTAAWIAGAIWAAVQFVLPYAERALLGGAA